MSRWRIEIDQQSCTGSGMCVALAPDHFVIDHSKSYPAVESVDADENVRSAAQCCPNEAITVTDVSTGAAIFAAEPA